jgi:hypothetical protein
VACVALALAAPARAQDDEVAAVPDIFRGAASSLVASVEADRDALLPVDDVFRFVALDGSTVYETDLQTARASLLFPGNGLILGPNLACGTFGGSFPPEFASILEACTRYDYPLSVRADATTSDRTTAGAVTLGTPADAVSGHAASATAHAAPDGSHSVAAMEDLRVLGLPVFGPIPLLPLEQIDLDPSVLLVESATSRTDQRIDQGVLTVEAEAVLSGVRLVGGLVRIGSIQSRARVTDDAAGERTADASLEVSGVTVAGLPAQITEDGLVLGSSSSGPLQQQLQTLVNQVLEGLNVRIELLDVEETVDDGEGQAVASAGGLLIEVAVTADGLPMIPGPLGDIDPNGTYVGSVQLGSTAAAGGAATFEIEEPPAPPDLPTDLGGGLPFDSGGSLPDTGGAVDLPAPSVDEVARPSAPTAPSPPELVRRLTDPFGGRVGLVYLAFMFSVLGLCVMPRLTLPARLPGARS